MFTKARVLALFVKQLKPETEIQIEKLSVAVIWWIKQRKLNGKISQIVCFKDFCNVRPMSRNVATYYILSRTGDPTQSL